METVMNRTMAILVTLFVLIGCTAPQEPSAPKGPWDPDKVYTESCSDIPGRAALENLEASLVEIQLACLTKDHPSQGRVTMSYHPTLGKIARARALDMSINGFYGAPNRHVDNSGRGPEWYLCHAGYEIAIGACDLVDKDPTLNSVESIAMLWDSEVTPADAKSAILTWFASPPHKAHLLATESYFTSGIYFGVGHAYTPASPDNGVPAHYWVFIAAPPPLSE